MIIRSIPQIPSLLQNHKSVLIPPIVEGHLTLLDSVLVMAGLCNNDMTRFMTSSGQQELLIAVHQMQRWWNKSSSRITPSLISGALI